MKIKTGTNRVIVNKRLGATTHARRTDGKIKFEMQLHKIWLASTFGLKDLRREKHLKAG